MINGCKGTPHSGAAHSDGSAQWIADFDDLVGSSSRRPAFLTDDTNKEISAEYERV
jgi:hypothetical protein